MLSHWETRYRNYIEHWRNGEVTGMRGKTSISAHIKRYLFEKFDAKCTGCGWSKVHPVTGRIPLEVEHIDGNWMNNSEDNLTLLCPNCHALTSTYRGLNMGHGRSFRVFERVGKQPGA